MRKHRHRTIPREAEQFNLLLEQVVKENLLDAPCAEYPDLTKDALELIRSCPDLEPIHLSIQRHLQTVQEQISNFSPKPLTLGSFFFGAYLPEDRYSTRNKYCDPKASFSIPKLDDEVQTCDSNILFQQDDETSIFLDYGEKGTVVHLGPHAEVPHERLRRHGCQKFTLYRNGCKIEQSSDSGPEWHFPESATPRVSRDLVVEPSNTPQVSPDFFRRKQPNYTAPLVFFLTLIYVWVGLNTFGR